MQPAKMYVPGDVGEVRDHLSWMLLKSPRFLDKTGHFPFQNLDYVFRQLNEGLGNIRQTLGEQRYHVLRQMSDRMRVHFEADPDDKNGETLEGCKVIHAMEDLLREAWRKS